jgi:hypothetical protein
MATDDEQKPGFKVTDRRRTATEAAPSDPMPAHDPKGPPPIDFSTFVLSLAQTAMIQLGVVPHPETGERSGDPAFARETIDILGMLREKTLGNLSDEEQKFFDALLYDLRMQYVAAVRGN